jgi:heme exporter protein B
MGEIGVLLKKELLLEWRQRHTVSGILLYVLSTVYIVYVSAVRVQPQQWYVLFWIIVLFATVNAVAKSFVQENSARQLYYYSLVPPTAVLFSKVIYNMLLLALLSLLTFVVFGFVAGNPVKETGQFVLVLLLGSMGFSTAFTFISAIASKSKNGATLMAVLGFPVIVPILLTLVKLSAGALRLVSDSAIWKDLAILMAINVMLLSLTYLLFPFLWRD